MDHHPDRRAIGEVSRYPATTLAKLADPDPVDGLACMRDRAPTGASDSSLLARRRYEGRCRWARLCPMGKQHAQRARARDTALITDHRYNPFGSPRFAPFKTDSATCDLYAATATAKGNPPHRALHFDGINWTWGAPPDNTVLIAESRDGLVRFSRRKPYGSTRGFDRQAAAGSADRRHRAQATNFKLLLCDPGRFSLLAFCDGGCWRSHNPPSADCWRLRLARFRRMYVHSDGFHFGLLLSGLASRFDVSVLI
jgi:hypothetical protein